MRNTYHQHARNKLAGAEHRPQNPHALSLIDTVHGAHDDPSVSVVVMSAKSFIGAVKDEWRLFRYALFSTLRPLSPSLSFSDRPDDYTIGSPIGFGASSVVYAAVYNPPPPEHPRPFPCALKVLDLDSLPLHSLALLQRETQLMSLSKHPNVLRVRGSWVDGHKLHIALRLMNKGSAADIMKYAWPSGMEEEVVRCILKQALEGLKSVLLSQSPSFL